MRLIDADALEEDIREYLFDDDELEHSKNRDSDRGYNNGLKCAIRRTKMHAPTVDAVPVVHSKWGEAQVVGYDGTRVIYGFPCGKCGKHVRHIGCGWCPWCGAKMDAKEKTGD